MTGWVAYLGWTKEHGSLQSEARRAFTRARSPGAVPHFRNRVDQTGETILFILFVPAFYRQTLSASAVPRIALSVSSASIKDFAFLAKRQEGVQGNGRLAPRLER